MGEGSATPGALRTWALPPRWLFMMKNGRCGEGIPASRAAGDVLSSTQQEDRVAGVPHRLRGRRRPPEEAQASVLQGPWLGRLPVPCRSELLAEALAVPLSQAHGGSPTL